MAFLRLVNNHNTHTLISAQYGNIEKLASKNTTQVFSALSPWGQMRGKKKQENCHIIMAIILKSSHTENPDISEPYKVRYLPLNENTHFQLIHAQYLY